MSKLRTVTTTGFGAARVVPDAAVLRLAVTRRAEGVAEAFEGVDAAARKVTAVAKDFTEHTMIASSGLTVWPAHDSEGRQSGFEARHSLTIGCADLRSAGALLTQLAKHVGDSLRVEGISLEVTDQTAAEAQARQSAFADARVRAEQLASLSAESLGPVMSVIEGGGGGGFREGSGGMAFAKHADMAIEPGEANISSALTVTWAFAK
jgi:uncharacterized protein